MVTPQEFNERGIGHLPGLLGIETLRSEPGRLVNRLTIRSELLAPNGYLHAATVIALADTACGYGTIANLPPGAINFTTIELKSNFMGTARDGEIGCEATLMHGGRTTQVWQARVYDAATDVTLALFTCTQLMIYPR